jgi:hypothetical protein
MNRSEEIEASARLLLKAISKHFKRQALPVSMAAEYNHLCYLLNGQPSPWFLDENNELKFDLNKVPKKEEKVNNLSS